MAKKIKFESFKYHFLMAARKQINRYHETELPGWSEFIKSLEFNYRNGKAAVGWQIGNPGMIEFALVETRFYVRGDNDKSKERQTAAGMIDDEDPVKLSNKEYFKEAVELVANAAGYHARDDADHADAARYAKEQAFHDAWAVSEQADDINVIAANEACTAPEMRYITARLGDIRGKRLLDVGCGLGEASVYFATKGALVTSMDISAGMLDATRRLAKKYEVEVHTHQSAAEELLLQANEKFDIIYAGNLLHHVDIKRTMLLLKPHLADGGLLVTWDPMAYNPIINVYRIIATEVRTPDEHPLRLSDIRVIKEIFPIVETRYFWLSTLVIFLVMALVQRRNPNKERFWKVIINEGETWRWLYRPLEIFDGVLLKIIPPLRLLCWNVVIVARNK